MLLAGASVSADFAGSAAGMLAMVLNISGDLSGSITPVMVLLWPFAALGADAAGSLVRGTRRSARLATTAALTVAAVMPVANVVRNYRTADQTDKTSAARFFRSAFSQLPDRAGVVVEDYYYDMALHTGARTAPRRSRLH